MRQKNEYLGVDAANFVKYMMSFLAVIVSYLANIREKEFFYLWIPIAITSSLYSYYWDLKYDWGLLEPNVE